jgi:hypothetical protein
MGAYRHFGEPGGPKPGPMNAPPLRFLMMIFAGWVNRHRQDAIEYRQEENRALCEQLGRKRQLLVVVEVVVGRLERQRDIHLKEGLAHGLVLLDVPNVHRAHLGFSFLKGPAEFRVLLQLIARSLPGVRGFENAGVLSCDPEGEGGRVVPGTGPAMGLQALPYSIRSTNVEMPVAVREKVNAAKRDVARETRAGDRDHLKQRFERRLHCVHVGSENFVQCSLLPITPVSSRYRPISESLRFSVPILDRAATLARWANPDSVTRKGRSFGSVVANQCHCQTDRRQDHPRRSLGCRIKIKWH